MQTLLVVLCPAGWRLPAQRQLPTERLRRRGRASRGHDVTPHGLRHTAGSLAITAGATVVLVQRMLGHSSPTVTLNVYSHLFADDLDSVADRLHAAKINAGADQVRTSTPAIMLCEDQAGDRDAV